MGDKVLIENVSVGVGTTGYGYNSSKYEYSLFTLTAVNVPLGGGVGFVTYSLDGYLTLRDAASHDWTTTEGLGVGSYFVLKNERRNKLCKIPD